MDKIDKAIEFLKQVDPGSYFDECAEIIETLVAQIEQNKPTQSNLSSAHFLRLKQMDAGARYYAKIRGLL